MKNLPPLSICHLDHADYQTTHDAMLARTLARIAQKKQASADAQPITADELWIVNHQDVYTLGQAGSPSISCSKMAPQLSKPIAAGK